MCNKFVRKTELNSIYSILIVTCVTSDMSDSVHSPYQHSKKLPQPSLSNSYILFKRRPIFFSHDQRTGKFTALNISL